MKLSEEKGAYPILPTLKSQIENCCIGTSVFPGNLSGQLDDLLVYPYALAGREVNALAQSGFRAATVTGAGAGATAGSWSLTPPAGLEGLYRLDTRGKDFNGLTDLTNLGNGQWTGIVDTLAPRVSGSSSSSPGFWDSKRVDRFTIQDFNLNLSGISSSKSCNGGLAVESRRNFDRAWAQSAGNAPRAFEVVVSCTQTNSGIFPSVPSSTSLTVCDLVGNCTAPTAPSSPSLSAPTQEAVSAVSVAVITPTLGTVLTTTAPISIEGSAEAVGFLKDLTVTVDSTPIYTATYANGLLTTTTFSPTWVPAGEGSHLINAEASDWTTNTVSSEPVTITLDLTAPDLAFGATVLTQTAYASPAILFRNEN